MISEIHELINSISFSLNPLVVTAGEPIRIPEVTNGDAGSFGTAFLFTVIFKVPNNFSRSLPVIFLFLKSTKTI